MQFLISHNAKFCPIWLSQNSLFCDFYYYIPLHTRSCLILTVCVSLSFWIHLSLEQDWIVMDWMPITTVASWDFIISAPLARPHLNAVALMKVLKYEQSHGRHLWTAELFTHPVYLINAFMRSEGLKSFPFLKTLHFHSSSISAHGLLFDV